MGTALSAPATGSWRVVAASVAGTSHVSAGQPCADAWVVRDLAMAGGGSALFVAVSDGAGSSPRAPEGAHIACFAAAELAAGWAAEHCSLGEFSLATAREWVERIRDLVGAIAVLDEMERRDYAATLLVALVDETGSVFAQVGDGAIVYRPVDGLLEPVFWPQNGEYANTTWFVTDDDAADVVQLGHASSVQDLALFTDGLQSLALRFASREAHAPFFEPMFQQLRTTAADHSDAAAAGVPAPGLDAQLAAFLGCEAVNARTDDDKTLVLVARQQGRP